MKTEKAPSLSSRFRNERARIDEPEPDHPVPDTPDLVDSKLDEELQDVVKNVPLPSREEVAPPGITKEPGPPGGNGHTYGTSSRSTVEDRPEPRTEAPASKGESATPTESSTPVDDGPPVNPIAQQTLKGPKPATAPAQSPPRKQPQRAALVEARKSEPVARPSEPTWEPSPEPPQAFERSQPRMLSPLAKGMIWLAGADDEKLARCPKWEVRKYEAFGATVLVPSTFGAIAASYAVSTVTPEGYDWIAYAFAAVWGLIILTIDRALLSSYRAFASPFTKFTQFILRFTVAILMGFAIAHPLTLLLFKDTIATEVDKTRDAEIEEVRLAFAENKANLQTRIAAANETFQKFDTQRQEAMNAPFEGSGAEQQPQVTETTSSTKQVMEEQVEQATTAKRAQLANLDTQLEKHNADLAKVREEYSKWQEEYDAEISGQRGGSAGIGPRAKSIEADQLSWRRTETARLTELVTSLTKQRTQLSDDILEAEQAIRSRYADTAAAEAESIREDELRIASLQRDLRSQRLAIFQKQQEELADQYKAQMDSAKLERDRLMAEDEQLAKLQADRIEKITNDPREDLLTQTLVLHHLFEKGDEGGHFAMLVYGMIAGLFMLIDTIPLVVKFFTKSSVYDRLIKEEEDWHGKPMGAKEINDQIELAKIHAESRRERDRLHMETELERKRLVTEHNRELLQGNNTDWRRLLDEQITVSVEDIEKVKEHNKLLFQLAQEDRNNTRQLLQEHTSTEPSAPIESAPQLPEHSAIAEEVEDINDAVEVETDGHTYDGAIGDQGLDQMVQQDANPAEPGRENRIGEKQDRAHGAEIPE